MRKIIVTESQAKVIVTHLINEQSTSAGEKSYRLCSLRLVEKGGIFYVFNPEINELEELPKLSELPSFDNRFAVIVLEGSKIKDFCSKMITNLKTTMWNKK